MDKKTFLFVGTFVLSLIGVLLGYVLSQVVLGFLEFNLLTLCGTISLLVIFGILYYILFWQLRQEQLQPIQQILPEQMDDDRITGDYLKNRLIARLSGDIAASERLIQLAKQNYPGMPENWYCERVLDELDREQKE
jgi:hypothetical protein